VRYVWCRHGPRSAPNSFPASVGASRRLPVTLALSASSPPSSTYSVSVGTKLAAATMALVFVVTSLIYVAISRYQRENLLHAKEAAAVGILRLFADSQAASVEFNDETAIKEALTTLGRNRDIDYAVLYSLPKPDAPAAKLGELARGAPEPQPTTELRDVSLVRRENRVVVSAPVRAPDNKPIANAVIAFSLAGENAAIAAVRRTTLFVSASVALGLVALLVILARVTIVRPLGKLVVASKRLGEGTSIEIDVRSNDEIGELATAFRNMASAIQAREQRISARNRDMRRVLDNVGQGFITLDPSGTMADERSAIVDQWFGTPQPGMTFWAYLSGTNTRVANWFRLGWASIEDGFLPLILCLEQLPRTVQVKDTVFEFTYRPVLDGETLEQVVIVVSDVTARVAQERSEQAQREMMAIFNRILADKLAFELFFGEAAALIDAIQNHSGAPSELKRCVHTLKGNCALYGLESIAAVCHDIEERLGADDTRADAGLVQALLALWQRVVDVRSQLARSDDDIQLDREDFQGFLEDLRQRVDHDVLASTFISWQYESASKRLNLLREQTEHFAKRFGKEHIQVVYESSRLRLPPEKWGPFWSAFAHVIRNAVDHGIEPKEQRVRLGKPARATIKLGIAKVGSEVQVTITDDGAGVNFEAVAQRAADRGLPHATRADLEAALFAEGLSSRNHASLASGRGIGLNAVQAMVQELGGRIVVETAPNVGTTFKFLLPANMLREQGASMSGARRSVTSG
jgi:signal transduction histidine kinase